MNEYDIEKAFAAIEEELIASMMRNMKRHKEWETDEGFQWTMWQADQLKALDKYKKQNSKKFQRRFNEINRSIKELIEEARKQGNMDQELEILEAIQNGWKPPRRLSSDMTTAAEFFKLNTRKLEALITATENDFKKAETAMLRMANDQYRQVIFNAQVYANTGAGTYEKAVDMATRDFRARGINCIEYKNGARHTMKDYARMAIRTAAKRAYLTGEGEKRQEWGISTVIMNKRGNPCPLCLPFVGKIMIDDVWSGGTSKDGPYPLMSSAIAAGLYHPNCKDSHSTYFPTVNEKPNGSFTQKEIDEIKERYRIEQKKQYAKRQVEKYSSLASNSMDEDEKSKYTSLKESWKYKFKRLNDSIHGGTKNKVEDFRKTLIGIENEHLKALFSQAMERVNFELAPQKRSFYRRKEQTIYLAPDAKLDTIAHELFHEIDNTYLISESGMLTASVKNDYKRLKQLADGDGKAIENMIKSKYPEILDIEGKMLERYRGISDILHGMSNKIINFGYGHYKPGYWEKPFAVEKETWAQYGRMLYLNDDKTIEVLQELFPETTNTILNTIKGMIK